MPDDANPQKFFLDFSNFNIGITLLAVQICWGCFCFMWRRRNGEGDLEDLALRAVIGCGLIISSWLIIGFTIQACNLFNNLFLDETHSLAIFDWKNYHMDRVDANTTDPLLDALAVTSALFALQMITRYLSLAFLIMIFPLAGILSTSRITERIRAVNGEKLAGNLTGAARPTGCTVFIQPDDYTYSR